ncbi:Lrp/AsnC ligand binding domain-containing protein [Rhizobium sp. SL86]|nr:Lrp/AsnC ligand binding domain-containing protein [Rhizobium sp. SL86]
MLEIAFGGGLEIVAHVGAKRHAKLIGMGKLLLGAETALAYNRVDGAGGSECEERHQLRGFQIDAPVPQIGGVLWNADLHILGDRFQFCQRLRLIRALHASFTRAIGYQIRAMVRIRPLPGKLHLVERLIQERPEFVECDKITGDDPFLARLVVHTIEQMDDVLEALSEHAVTSTAVIKGTSVKRRLPPL